MSTPWVCRRCLNQTLRRFRRGLPRYQSGTPSTESSAGAIKTVYPALLERARQIAVEHKTLSAKLNDAFDTQTAKRAGELAGIAESLQRWDKANESMSELQKLIRDPMSDEELRELASEDLESTRTTLNEASQSLTKSLVPKHPFEALPCLLEVRPGAGGSEAAIFTGDLLGMYQSYCAERGMRTTLVKYEKDDVGKGVTEGIIEIETAGAYGVLRCEAGVHRVQRVPATETKGRTHTSSASVMVLPSFPSEGAAEEFNFEDPSSDYYIDVRDVRTDVMRASGAGGQHVNKTESAVRLTHTPTNTVIFVQESRSQMKNREKAWSMLRSRIAQSRREAREDEILKLRRSVVGVAKIGRGDKIRTYNYGQQRITDHRSGLTVHGIEGVMAGGNNLEEIMVSVRNWMTERDVEDLIVVEGAKDKDKDKI